MKLKLLAAVLLTSAAFSASADDQSFNISLGNTFDFSGAGTLLSGGSDTITFNGLASGTYNVILSYHSNLVDITSATLNNQNTAYAANIPGYFSVGGFTITSGSPFTLVLNGTQVLADNLHNYHGSITVSPVPEPATYGMLLGGLGLVGFMARRKKQS
ncbi:FxDxF family PEP-CTERM protein [Duganella sp. CY15W]|uniref:FxDxF family PEP-CTERM protein n=1 Tax=Duganella sp. CY15W TaxID=2692172 RepID=UPI001926B7FF|nr:FxDxF family PEP-CTERM protein [Duganella sp. CY15W]